MELVSKHPKPEGVQAMYRLQVKDWFWTQEYTTYGVYLPYIANSSTTSACPSVYLTAPVSDTKVPNPVTVSWYPDPSPMTIQYYQNQTLIGETENALSGTAVEIPPGWTQIKIWEGGQVLDTVWFEVI